MHATPPPSAEIDAAEKSAADGVLLARFAQTHDEPAFAELVHRHGPLVMGVCQRVLQRRHDAEDAFQATFMALSRNAARIRVAETLGPWLYAAAYRIALRAAQQRHRRKETTMADEVVDRRSPWADMEAAHRLHVLEEELNRLPPRLRDPLVLHYMQGKTNRQVAAELGLTVRTVEGCQRRGKTALRRSLALKRVSLPLAAAALAAHQQSAVAAVPAALVQQTVSASLSFAASDAGAATNPTATSLAQTEVIAMTATAPSPLIAVIVALAIGGGALAIANQPSAGSGSAPLDLSTNASDASDGSSDDADATVIAAAHRRSPTAASPPAPLSESLHKPLHSELIIEEQLANAFVSAQFIDEPLGNVLEYLAAETRIAIVIDHVELDDLGLSVDEPVTIDLSKVRLRSALHHALQSVSRNLDYLVQDETLLITSRDRTLDHFETRVYRVNDAAQKLGLTTEQLCGHIQDSTGDPESWGRGAALAVPNNGLIIRQTQAVHREIVALLGQLDRLAAE